MVILADASSNPFTALVVEARGDGGCAEFFSDNPNVTDPIVDINAESASQALYVTQGNPGGTLARFEQHAPGVAADAVSIQVNNARHPLFVRQTGSGEAAHFDIVPGNSNIGVFVGNNGPGIGLRVESTSVQFGAVALSVGGKTALNGQVDILGGGGGAVPVNITGNVAILGNLNVTGAKNFRIDHPLDPLNRTLTHYCTEGAEPLNAYSGNVVTDESGYATVTLPEYFESINRDFRYQLTVVDEADSDAFLQVKVAQKILDNRFVIRTSGPNVEVSWRVEAVRNDAWMRAHGAPVEQEKVGPDRGKYLTPQLSAPSAAVSSGLSQTD